MGGGGWGSFGVYLSTISRSTKISNNETIFFCRGDKSVRHSIFGSQNAPLLCHSTREGWMEGMGGYIGNLTRKGMTCLTGKKLILYVNIMWSRMWNVLKYCFNKFYF